jgi:hypothetical protein
MENCMIQSKDLSIHYWVESINCATYIVNSTPTKDSENITPKETWTKIKPYVSHFHVFGSEAWVTFLMRKEKGYSLKVRSIVLLDILKISKVIYFFNLIPIK